MEEMDVRDAKARWVEAAALFGALLGTFAEVHPYCDQVLQAGEDARDKGLPGARGRRACGRHVASYSVGQLVAAVGVTRALGVRVPVRALATSALVNGVTHFIVDRRTPLKAFVRSRWAERVRLVGAGKEGYLGHATVQRRPGVVDEAGPGTALMEIDQAVHRLVGVVAAATATAVAMRRLEAQ
jgi:hypothetical protein